MLTCVCGAVLVSDGNEWYCPYEGDKNYHEKQPIRIPDKRTSTIGGQEKLKGRPVGKLIKG